MKTLPAITAALLFLAFALPASAQPKDAADEKDPKSKRVVELKGIDAVRHFIARSNYKEAEWYALPLLWKDIRQPELLHLLGQSVAKLNRREEAAAWYRLLLRVAEETPSDEAEKVKPHAEKYLKFGDAEAQRQAKAFEKEAGGKFPAGGPEKVGDAWMSQVTADLYALEPLLFLKAVGIEVDVREQDPLFVHTKQGAMHRSGMKLITEVDGRKGLLFTVPGARGADGKGATKVTIPYGGKGAALRFGMKGFIAPLTVEVSTSTPGVAGGPKLLTRPVPINTWSDVKVELKEVKTGDVVTLELVAGGRTLNAGVWIDYVGFYED